MIKKNTKKECNKDKKFFHNYKDILLEGIKQDLSDYCKKDFETLLIDAEFYKLCFDNSSDVISVITTDLHLIKISPSVERIFGYRPDELIGKSLLELNVLSLDYMLTILKDKDEFMSGKHITGREYTGKDKNGNKVVIEVNIKPITRNDTVIACVASARDITRRKQTELEHKETLQKLRLSLDLIIRALSMTVETRDPYTAGHQRRTADLARAIASEMGLDDSVLDGIRMAGTIHDLGKVSIPAEILSKPGGLCNLEFGLIKNHPDIGYEILKDIEFPWPVATIVRQHHERMDGSGYPLGLTSNEILIESKIIAVADVVEAMASHRPYRASIGIDKALDEINSGCGHIYDSDVVKACNSLFNNKAYRVQWT